MRQFYIQDIHFGCQTVLHSFAIYPEIKYKQAVTEAASLPFFSLTHFMFQQITVLIMSFFAISAFLFLPLCLC